MKFIPIFWLLTSHLMFFTYQGLKKVGVGEMLGGDARRMNVAMAYHRTHYIHFMCLTSLEHCICTTTMTNIRPDQDSNLVSQGYKPLLIRISHRGRPFVYVER